jgi:hypothetical protein
MKSFRFFESRYFRKALVFIPIAVLLSFFYTNCGSSFNADQGNQFASTVTSCEPGSRDNLCTVANGVGHQVCNFQGNGYVPNTCVPQYCNEGYGLENGVCKAMVCSPGTTENTCVVGLCTGRQTCNTAGTGYIDGCDTSGCSNGSTIQACVPNTMTACSNSTGSGGQLCNSTGTALVAPCSFSRCNAGYYLQNGQCKTQVCNPAVPHDPQNSAYDCHVDNGIGTQQCNSTGLGFVAGTCVTKTCNEGFALYNGSCHAVVLINKNTAWVKPSGITQVTIECVGGGGSGTNNQSWGLGGCSGKVVTKTLTRSSDAEAYNFVIGAAGYDTNCGWGSNGTGGTSNVLITESKVVNGVNTIVETNLVSAAGGEVSCSSVPAGTYTDSTFSGGGAYGRGGGGVIGANSCGSYGATAGACRILYK